LDRDYAESHPAGVAIYETEGTAWLAAGGEKRQKDWRRKNNALEVEKVKP
jgi:hypothetical protein